MKYFVATLACLFLLTGVLQAQVTTTPQKDPPARNETPPLRPPAIDAPPPPIVLQPAPGQPPFPGQGAPTPGFPMRQDFKELIPLMIEALGDKDAEVRKHSAQALARIGHSAVPALLEIFKDAKRDKELRASVASIFGQMGPAATDALPALTKAFKDSEGELRRRVAYAIAHIVPDYNSPFGYYSVPVQPRIEAPETTEPKRRD